MFLSNSKWEYIIRNHNVVAEEVEDETSGNLTGARASASALAGAAVVDDRAVDNDIGEADLDADEDSDDEYDEDDEDDDFDKENEAVNGPLGRQNSYRSKLLRVPVSLKPAKPTHKLDEERLNQLVAKLAEETFDTVQPGTYDEEFRKIVPNLRILPANNNIIALQTCIRDRNSPREDFVFNADRLIRLVIEEGLNQLPSKLKKIITPTGGSYRGVEFLKSNCGISIVRSGEAMEKALRDCCRSIRIGKILIQSDEDTHHARVLYAKLPADISLRKVLLLYPIMSTGNTVVKAIKVLKKNGVKEHNIILINLFTTPNAIRQVATRFNELTIQTTEVHPVAPLHFGQKYFGTD